MGEIPPSSCGFQQRFTELKRAAYGWDLWLVAWLCQGGLCSDDSFGDFCNWLLSRGQALYELALREPDALMEELRQTELPEFELFGYAAAEAYRGRTGRELADLPEYGATICDANGAAHTSPGQRPGKT